MNVSTAVLAAGASIAAVGVAQLVQRGRQHKQRNDLATSLIQIEWLSRASSDKNEAAYWAPEGMEPAQYQPLLSANRMFCQLSLLHRPGLLTDRQLVLYADKRMESAAARAYWARFGEHRQAEALGKKTDEHFTRATMVA